MFQTHLWEVKRPKPENVSIKRDAYGEWVLDDDALLEHFHIKVLPDEGSMVRYWAPLRRLLAPRGDKSWNFLMTRRWR